MRKTIIILAMCILICIAPALATVRGTDSAYDEKISVIHRVFTNPCTTRPMNTTNGFYVSVGGYVCAPSKADYIYWTVLGECYSNGCNGLDNWLYPMDPGDAYICDDPSIRVILYFGDSNVQDTGWQNISQSNITVNSAICNAAMPSHNSSYMSRYMPDNDFCYWAFQIPEWVKTDFKLNKTGYYQMRVYLRSEQNVSIAPAVQLINYTVAIDGGVIFGNCTSSSATTAPIVSEDAITVSLGDNKAFYWILLMVALGIVIFVGGRDDQILMNTKLAVGLMVELFLLIIGSYLGIISWVPLAVIVVILVAIIGNKIKELFT